MSLVLQNGEQDALIFQKGLASPARCMLSETLYITLIVHLLMIQYFKSSSLVKMATKLAYPRGLEKHFCL